MSALFFFFVFGPTSRKQRPDSHCYPRIATYATCSLKKEYLESFKGNESYESQLHGCCRNVASDEPGATLATTCCTKRCQRHQTKSRRQWQFFFLFSDQLFVSSGLDSHCYPCIATYATCSLKKEYSEFFKGNESHESQRHGCCRDVFSK